MTGSKHTPGPWFWDPANEYRGPIVRFGPHEGGFQIHPDTPNAKGNARLIAAAPDLLEALEECRKFAWHHAQTEHGRRAANMADAAIAKARGQS